MVLQKIKSWIRESIGTDADFGVEYPKDATFGDVAVNVAMVMSKKEKKNPKDLADEYVALLQKNLIPEVSGITVANPGFINITLKPEVFQGGVSDALTHKQFFGSHQLWGKEKFFIEHTTPNPFKEFHIGHLMNNTIGESIVRIVRAQGAEVKTATYHGDKGLHIAKAIWALQKNGEDLTLETMGKSYAEGHTAFGESEDAKAEIIAINKKIYDGSDDAINALYEKGRALSFQYFESLYQLLGSQFDFHLYESESGEIGTQLVTEHIGTVFEKSEGAVIFKGEDVGLHTRVFINSEGLPTYEAKEVGLASIKKNLYDYNQSVTITANEQDAFFKVVEVAIGRVFPELAHKLTHLSHGMMKLPSGKMSSRTGTIVSALGLVDSAQEVILEKMEDRNIAHEQKKEISQMIAIGALKYSILKQAIGGDIVFDMEKALSFEGDSGPYLQYATVRAEKVLSKCREVGIDLDTTLPDGWTTTLLEKYIVRFPDVVLRAGEEYAPQYIVTYLTELASVFNSFYAEKMIADKVNPESAYRMAITNAFVHTMTNGLNLLGIGVPSEM